jgi:hypothetical protein
MNTFNGSSFARVTKCKKQESEKVRVMSDNLFIQMDQMESFGISVLI